MLANAVRPLEIVLGILVLFVSAQAAAQPVRSTPEARVERRMQVWKSELGLTADQEKQVRDIMREREKQWDADHQKLLAAAPADRPALRDAQRTHMQSFRDRLHAVLTPAQQQKALKLREMRGSGRGMGRGSGPANGPRRRNGSAVTPQAK